MTGGDRTVLPRIGVLPTAVRERVAAGEVIDGPAAVVKELIENSLDARATRVDVEIQASGAQPGFRLIRVADDGHGIPPEDVVLAFQRYATSKIQTAGDLHAIRTLGFRGEALPSIAAVSEVTLVTRTPGDFPGRTEPARRVIFAEGVLVGQGQEARVPGTTVSVCRLFERLPGRLKFLQGRRVESQRIAMVVRRLALSRPDVRISLRSDGRLILQTRGAGPRETLADVFGPAVAAAAAVVGPYDRDALRVYGFITGRELTRPTRGDLCLFVNGRWVESAELLGAVEAGYRPVLPRGRHPIVVLFVDVPLDEVDVNVHPSKREVRHTRPSELGAALTGLVRDTLGTRPAMPLPPSVQDGLPSLLPTMPAGHGRRQRPADRAAEHGWQQSACVAPGSPNRLRAVAQLGDALLVCEAADGLYLVDQHRAHERVLYERLRQQLADGGAGRLAQGLVEPIALELKPHEAARLASRLDDLAALGLRCEWFGSRGFLVHSIPAPSDTQAVTMGISEVLAAASSEGDWRDQLLVALACRSALRKGRALALAEANALLDELARTEAPAVCPHGSPIVVHLGDAFLARLFDWR